MKKFLIVLLTIVMTLSYSACTKEPTEYGAFIGDPYGEVVELDLDQLTYDPDWRITDDAIDECINSKIRHVYQAEKSENNYVIILTTPVKNSDVIAWRPYFEFTIGIYIDDEKIKIENMAFTGSEAGFSIDFDYMKAQEIIIFGNLETLTAEELLQQTPLYGDVGKEIESAQAFIDGAKVATTAAFQIWSNVPVE